MFLISPNLSPCTTDGSADETVTNGFVSHLCILRRWSIIDASTGRGEYLVIAVSRTIMSGGASFLPPAVKVVEPWKLLTPTRTYIKLSRLD